MAQQEDNESELGPQTVGDGDKRGGLEPEEFQRELIVVTATVLILGIVGGSCLGMKIQRAERAQNAQANHQESGAPSAPAAGSSATSGADESAQR